MCGSGTFLIEAALMATQTAPGLLRKDPWAFECWHDFEQSQWQQIQQHAQERAQQGRVAWEESEGQLLGNDMHQVGFATWSLLVCADSSVLTADTVLSLELRMSLCA